MTDRIDLNDNDAVQAHNEWLERTNKKDPRSAEEKKRGFSIGDRVRISIGDAFSHNGHGTIEKMDNDDRLPFRVQLDDDYGGQWCWDVEHEIPVTAPTTMAEADALLEQLGGYP